MPTTPLPVAAEGCPDDTLDIRTASAMSFVPWKKDVGLTFGGIVSGARTQIHNAQIALAMMYLTKDELVERCREHPEMMQKAIDTLESSAEAFAEIGSMIESARCRAIVAFAAFALDGEEASI